MVKVNDMNRYIVQIILLAATAVSCKSELVSDGELPQEMIDLTIEAVIESEADAKTSLGGDNSLYYRDVLWNQGDEIAFFPEGESSFSKFVNQNKQDAQETALFYGSVQKSESYAAFYPYSSVKTLAQDKVNFMLPAIQQYTKDGFADGMSPMIGRLDDVTLSFKNLCGILVLNLIGTDAVSSITFRGYDAYDNPLPVAGSASVNYTNSSILEVDMSGSTEYMVTLECGDGVPLSETKAVPFHIILPPGEYPNFELEINMVGGKIMHKKGSKPLRIARSVRTKTAELVAVGKHVNTDLSYNGSANCYIVSETGSYRFKAVEGNSNTSVGRVSNVAVLWEGFGTGVTPVIGDLIKTVSYSDGYIGFSTADVFKEGNAVIAALDLSGYILWSWHIWMTDQPEEQDYYNNAGTMMDRNLGATSPIPGDVCTLGLLYQWGRKDPFPGSNMSTVSSDYSWRFYTIVANERGSVYESIENPMSFYPGFSIENWDWLYSYRDNDLWGSNKTIYDPCPVGWRVPDGGSNSIWAKACGEKTFNHPYLSTKGMDFSGKFGDATTIWYPAAGQRFYSDGRLFDVGSKGRYWSATAISYSAYSFSIDDTHYVSTSNSDWRAEANSVRCQKEDISNP